jgi:hypothetical protein
MQHHHRIAAIIIPDHAQHFPIPTRAVPVHVEHLRPAIDIFDAQARVVIAVRLCALASLISTPFALTTATAKSRNANVCLSAPDMGAAFFYF